MAQYLVTGGAGFIGSHLVGRTCPARPPRARGRLPGHRQAKQPRSRARRRVPRGRSRRPRLRAQAVAGSDFVLHQAAIPSVPRSVTDPITSNRANVDATLNVLVAARDAGVRRVVFAGSSSAYGNTRDVAEARGHADRARSRPTRCRSWWASSTCRCSRRSTGSRPSRSATSTCSVRGRIRRRPTPASSRCSPWRSSRTGRRRSTATASRPATSRTSPTSSTACCAPARPPVPAAASSTWPPAPASRSTRSSRRCGG